MWVLFCFVLFLYVYYWFLYWRFLLNDSICLWINSFYSIYAAIFLAVRRFLIFFYNQSCVNQFSSRQMKELKRIISLWVANNRFKPNSVLGLPHCRQILYCLSHQGNPRLLEWIAYLFSRGSSQSRNWTQVSPALHVDSLPAELPGKSSKYCMYVNSFTGHLDNPMLEVLVMNLMSSLQMRPGEEAGYLPLVKRRAERWAQASQGLSPTMLRLSDDTTQENCEGWTPRRHMGSLQLRGGSGPSAFWLETTTDVASNRVWHPE